MAFDGRWRKYTPKEFGDALIGYLDSITYEETMREITGVEHGKPVYGEPLKNRNGDIITRSEYAVPPEITRICLSLGISRQTWNNYAKKKGYSEYVEYARMVCRAYLSGKIIEMGRDCKGAVYLMDKNYPITQEDAQQNTEPKHLSAKEIEEGLASLSDIMAAAPKSDDEKAGAETE